MCEVQTHEGIARLQHSEKHCCVGLCTRVRLHVGIFCSEEFLYTLNGQCLHLIYHLAAAIITLAGISLSVLVGEI